MSPVPRLKDFRGPALLSYGFRPFFLLGAVYAGLAILAWLPMFNGELNCRRLSARSIGTCMKCSTAMCRRW